MDRQRTRRSLSRSLGLAAFCSIGLLLSASGARAQNLPFTFNGTVTTPASATGNAAANNQPISFIKVIVYDEDTLFDDELVSGFTTAAGAFSLNYIWNPIAEGETLPDVYVDIEWTGQAVDGRLIHVDPTTAGNTHTDHSVQGAVLNDLPSGVKNFGTLTTSTDAPNIITQIGNATRTLKSRVPTWNMPSDLFALARNTNGASFVANDGSHMSIAFEDYDHPGAGNAAFSDMHHEFFHWVAYRAYGNNWPQPRCNGNPHSSSKQTCEAFAMQEGSAQFNGSTSYAPGDQKTGIPSGTTWRGQDGSGSDNSGEIVEGALERIWRMDGDIPGNLYTLLTYAPNDMRAFKVWYAIYRGVTSAQLLSYLGQAAQNGIVYTRLKLDKFTEGDPPNDAASATDGNYKVINMTPFVRGVLTAEVSDQPKSAMNLAAASAVDAATLKNLGYKTANAGLGDVASGFTYVGAVPVGSDLQWDTKNVADGDYDVIVQATNGHTWIDVFYPDFAGDSMAATNSDEKWLKKNQTWFNLDNTPSTDLEGKVVVDNEAPTASNFYPQ